MDAGARLVQFRNATGAGTFPNITRQSLADGIADRIYHPEHINQRGASLCGPASFFYCLIQDNKDAYVSYVCDLYETGQGKLGSLTVKPSRDCRSFSPGTKIAPVDWVALASLRDSENTIFDYQSDNDDASGITMPHSMAAWFRAVGYSGVKNETNTFFSRGEGTVKEMSDLLDGNQRVCLFINAQMIKGHPDNHSMLPNHWVVLEYVDFKDGQVDVMVWSWADNYSVPAEAPTMAVGPFTRNLYGYVSAHPT